METQLKIPIYRGLKLGTENEYVMGWYSSPIIIEGKTYLSITNKDGEYRIDTTTLSIHFPNMLDSQGNKIFASLQEDGKGGDLIDNFYFIEKYRIQIAIYTDNCFYLVDVDSDRYNLKEYINEGGIRVMGIQEWKQYLYYY